MSNVLKMSQSNIVFLNTLVRICQSNGPKEVDEIVKTLKSNIPFKTVLKKLKIDFDELTSILNVVSGNYKPANLDDLLQKTGLSYTSDELLLFNFCKFYSPDRTLEELQEDYKQTINQMASSNFMNDPEARHEVGAACMALTAGNFMILRLAKKSFSWYLVHDDSDQTEAQNQLAMAICGLTNKRV